MEYLILLLFIYNYFLAKELSDITQNKQFRILIKISEQKLYLYQGKNV